MSTQAASAPASAPTPPKKKKSNAKLKRLSGEALAAYNARIQNCGVCYLARVPPYMKPSALRKLLSGYGTEVLRIYLKQEDPAARARRISGGGNRKRSFSEGWVEFADKRRALKLANTLNNTLVGGGHRSFHAHDLWNIKYLHKFKWDSLTDAQAHEARTAQDRMRAELSQSKKETSFYMKQVGQAKAIEAMAARRARKAAAAADTADTSSAAPVAAAASPPAAIAAAAASAAPASSSKAKVGAGAASAKRRRDAAPAPPSAGSPAGERRGAERAEAAAGAASSGLASVRRSFKQRRVQSGEGRRTSKLDASLLLPGAE
mmetsp:Transcript_19379/g.62438  ORF Transcript_19379/g.62438 Transcript_19379/m.62438 type:complete len:319 (+) Transcript_19379:12-968(+)